MEFGVLGFDGFSSEHTTKQKCCGSTSFLEQERAVTSDVFHDFIPSKVAKQSNDFSPSKNLSLKDSSFVLSDAHQKQNMLSFSSPKLENKNLQNSAFAYFQHPSPSYSKNAGYSSSGGVNTRMCFLNGVNWPFTTSQWLELEQQALIYKYIIANEPIPPNLLIPIKRAFESAGFCSFPGGFLRPNTYGWTPFHLGFSNSSDPEPGRCRRTDGKKWRCSREAVPDQKYCERHINRGRHRSRKPVEAHSGHSLSVATTSKTNSPAHFGTDSTSSSAPLVVLGGAAFNSFAVNHNYSRNTSGLNFLSPAINTYSSDNTFSVDKDQQYPEAPSGGFTFVTSDQTSSLYGANASSCHDINAQKSVPQRSFRPFVDDPSTVLWPKTQAQPETTQLSISIPVAPSDYRSSTSSPIREKVTLSPLRLSREIDSVQMGLGHCKQPNVDPVISWGTSVGGPLGEALKTTSNNSVDHGKNLSALKLLSKGWEGSPQSTSSPTGVLKRSALGSLSNSSAGSSPRADHGKAPESGRMLWDKLSVL